MTSKRRRPPAEDARAILDGVRQLVRSLRLYDKEGARQHGLGAAQMFLLHLLLEQEGLSMNALAERAATDQSSASIAASRLVAEGLVRRELSPHDRRQVQLFLTPRGRALARRAPVPAQQRILAAVERMNETDRMRLSHLLARLVDALGAAELRPGMLFQHAATKAAAKDKSANRIELHTSRRRRPMARRRRAGSG
jgi:MarR family transcriptional regulator, organic hydroperoxide resistance regulator